MGSCKQMRIRFVKQESPFKASFLFLQAFILSFNTTLIEAIFSEQSTIKTTMKPHQLVVFNFLFLFFSLGTIQAQADNDWATNFKQNSSTLILFPLMTKQFDFDIQSFIGRLNRLYSAARSATMHQESMGHLPPTNQLELMKRELASKFHFNNFVHRSLPEPKPLLEPPVALTKTATSTTTNRPKVAAAERRLVRLLAKNRNTNSTHVLV